jgi:hypothetical protein
MPAVQRQHADESFGEEARLKRAAGGEMEDDDHQLKLVSGVGAG